MLREFRADDADALCAYATDPKVLEKTHWQVFSLDDAVAWIAQMGRLARRQPRIEYQWALTLPPDDTPVGGARMRIESTECLRASIGYILASRLWGNGYATEAARMIIDFGFDRLHLHRIEALAEPGNEPSWRVLERVGMDREGLLRDYLLDRGRLADAFIYARIGERSQP